MKISSGNMAATSASLQEWLVIAPDFQNSLDKRLAVRGEHLSKLKEDREDFWLWGGTLSLPSILVRGNSADDKHRCYA